MIETQISLVDICRSERAFQRACELFCCHAYERGKDTGTIPSVRSSFEFQVGHSKENSYKFQKRREIALLFSYISLLLLTDGIFETGPYRVPSKSQNPTHFGLRGSI